MSSQGRKPSGPSGAASDRVAIDVLKERILERILKSPEKAVSILTQWLSQPRSTRVRSAENSPPPKKDEKKKAA